MIEEGKSGRIIKLANVSLPLSVPFYVALRPT